MNLAFVFVIIFHLIVFMPGQLSPKAHFYNYPKDANKESKSKLIRVKLFRNTPRPTDPLPFTMNSRHLYHIKDNSSHEFS